jgi:putative SOS response-associated peptidase YedK
MCGRFAQFTVLENLQSRFPIDTVACEITPSYNVAPSQEILSIIRLEENRLLKLHWGIVPFWVKDIKKAAKPINARVETAAEKPSFKAAFRYRRCLILADGFYEWKKIGSRKQPWFLTLPEKRPFAFAGLWDAWTGDDGAVYHSCTILTTAASDSIREIHHRMPIVLNPDAFYEWLNPDNQDTSKLDNLLREQTVQKFIACPVSTYVNSPKNNDPKCIRPEEEN